ncbi:MAG: hypothetical protein F7B95_02405 [Desulfurococcales archaeon]|nr:hypothetical protein [Desulfurococcales archaeon]
MASCRLTLMSRVLIVIGVSIILAGVLAEVFGAKTQSTWSGTEALDKGEVLALMVWATAASGKVEISVDGVQSIYYTVVRGDPLSLVANSTAFGVRIEATEVYHDFRGGVFYAVADVSMDPIAFAFAASRFKVSSNPLTLHLETRESIILMLPPPKLGGGTVSYNVTYTVEGYSRTSLPYTIVSGAALALVGTLVPCSRRNKYNP